MIRNALISAICAGLFARAPGAVLHRRQHVDSQTREAVRRLVASLVQDALRDACTGARAPLHLQRGCTTAATGLEDEFYEATHPPRIGYWSVDLQLSGRRR